MRNRKREEGGVVGVGLGVDVIAAMVEMERRGMVRRVRLLEGRGMLEGMRTWFLFRVGPRRLGNETVVYIHIVLSKDMSHPSRSYVVIFIKTSNLSNSMHHILPSKATAYLSQFDSGGLRNRDG
jgi:hypothetical protein